MSEMVEVQTSELTGLALDWVIDGIESDKPLEIRHHKNGSGDWIFVADGVPYQQGPRKFSSDWGVLGPLLTKYRIEFKYASDDVVKAVISSGVASYPVPGGYGQDHMIAACRAIVLDELGHSVMVPKELLS